MKREKGDGRLGRSTFTDARSLTSCFAWKARRAGVLVGSVDMLSMSWRLRAEGLRFMLG
jgi:hypothetical protein